MFGVLDPKTLKLSSKMFKANFSKNLFTVLIVKIPLFRGIARQIFTDLDKKRILGG